MYAVIEIGGKQYRVQEGDELYVERTGREIGEEFSIEKVLLVKKGEDLRVEKEELKGVLVKAKVLEEVKGPKIRAMKYKPKKNYRRRWGHRQKYHKIQILSIEV